MFNPKQLEALVKDLYNAIPDNVQRLEKNIKQQFHDILHSTFSQLDLVTREEFDVQAKVLARTRQKVELLQAQVQELLELQKEKPK